jgi:hypothetical protein
MIHDRESTEARFFEEYDRMKLDLAEAQQKVMLLTDQLRQANAENQAFAYKVDFLKLEVDRVTASREQYERVAIRVSAKMEGATAMMIRQLGDLQEEIKAAAFAEVPGKVKDAPERPAEAEEPLSERISGKGELGLGIHGIPKEWPEGSFSLEVLGKLIGAADEPPAENPTKIDTRQIGRNYGAGFGDSASLLPPPRFGNGPINS